MIEVFSSSWEKIVGAIYAKRKVERKRCELEAKHKIVQGKKDKGDVQQRFFLVSCIISGVVTQVGVDEKLIICFGASSGKEWENTQIIMKDASQDFN